MIRRADATNLRRNIARQHEFNLRQHSHYDDKNRNKPVDWLFRSRTFWKKNTREKCMKLLIILFMLIILSTFAKTFFLKYRISNSTSHTYYIVNDRKSRNRKISLPEGLQIFSKNDSRDNPTSSEFAKEPLTGYYSLPHSSNIESSTQHGKIGDTNEIKLYFPLVDLQDKYSLDEAYKKQKQIFPPNMQNNFRKSDQITMPQLFTFPSVSSNFLKYGYEKLVSITSTAILTRRCFKGGTPSTQVNQDRSFIMTSTSSANTDDDETQNHNNFVMGIFDGHGNNGHLVSHYIALELSHHTFLRNLLQEKQQQVDDKEIRQVLNETFRTLDIAQPVKSGSGSTCALILRIEEYIYISSVGDSKVFVASYNNNNNKIQIHLTNRIDKPHLEKERSRIESMGGTVWVPPFSLSSKLSSRVMFNLANGEELALAMSRSIGDLDATPIGVISEPNIDLLNLFDIRKETETDVFLAVAVSDGLLDLITEKEMFTRLFNATTQNSNGGKTLLQVCEELILESSKAWALIGFPPYRDDISIAVHKFII